MMQSHRPRSGDFIVVPLPNANYGAIRVLTVYPDKKVARTLPVAKVLEGLADSFISRVYEYYDSSMPTVDTLRRKSFITDPVSTSIWAVRVRDKWPVIGNTPLAEDEIEEPTLTFGCAHLVKGAHVWAMTEADRLSRPLDMSSVSTGWFIHTILSYFGHSPQHVGSPLLLEAVAFFEDGHPLDVKFTCEQLLVDGVSPSKLEAILRREFTSELTDDDDGPFVRVAMAYVLKNHGAKPSVRLMNDVRRDLEVIETLKESTSSGTDIPSPAEMARIRAVLFG